GESPGDGKPLFGGVLAIGDLAYREFGDQGRVSGENAEIAVLAGDLDLLGRRFDYFLFRRDNFELESISHRFERRSWLRRSCSLFLFLSLSHHLTWRRWQRRCRQRLYAAAFIFSAACSTSSMGPFM